MSFYRHLVRSSNSASSSVRPTQAIQIAVDSGQDLINLYTKGNPGTRYGRCALDLSKNEVAFVYYPRNAATYQIICCIQDGVPSKASTYGLTCLLHDMLAKGTPVNQSCTLRPHRVVITEDDVTGQSFLVQVLCKIQYLNARKPLDQAIQIRYIAARRDDVFRILRSLPYLP